jgi:paraquat-inducible protein B
MKQNGIPEVEESEKLQLLTSVWIVPIIALIIALWLAYQYFSELGPKVKIAFESSGGLVAGQSQVKLKDVPVGVVKKIELREGKKGVLVTVRLNRDAEPYLNEDTKFWIARPKIDTKGISGLDTLMSGSYIAMYGKRGGDRKREFIGLEEPYIDKDAIKGKRYKLSAPDSRDLSVGADVYYRKIKVGSLESIKLSSDGEKVDFIVFIKEPYTKFVNTQTQFWKVNNVNLDFSRGALKLDIAPISTILNGAIAFSTTTKSMRSRDLKDSHIFPLYEDYSQARQKEIGIGDKEMRAFMFNFDEPIGSLEIGAPIEFYGFQVGHVVNIESDFDKKQNRIDSIVIGLIDISAFMDVGDDNISDGFNNLKEAVNSGLKARLSISNPLTGSLYIELVKDTKSAPGFIVSSGSLLTFPTMSSNFDGIMDKLASMVDKINDLDLNSTVANANSLIANTDKRLSTVLDKLSKSVDKVNVLLSSRDIKNLPNRVNSSLKALENSLTSLNALVEGDSSKSMLADRINEVLKELYDMSRAVTRLTEKLDKKPNALIFGD